MPQIDRKALEKAVSLRRARNIVESFCKDRVTYSDEDFHKKKGVCKVLREEYLPLVGLAQAYHCVRSVHLLSQANPGPDGEIRFWCGHSSKVQIICSNELGNGRYLMREQLASKNIGYPCQSLCRNKQSKDIEITGGGFLTNPDADVQARVARILKAIEKKEKKYYPDTDTLLVQDDVANFRHLKCLHPNVCDSVRRIGTESKYRRIYIRYGDELKRVK